MLPTAVGRSEPRISNPAQGPRGAPAKQAPERVFSVATGSLEAFQSADVVAEERPRADVLSLLGGNDELKRIVDEEKHALRVARVEQASHRRVTLGFLLAAVLSAGPLIPLALAFPFFAAAPFAVCLGLLFSAASPATSWFGGRRSDGASQGQAVNGRGTESVRPSLLVQVSQANLARASSGVEGDDSSDASSEVRDAARRAKESVTAELVHCKARSELVRQEINRLDEEAARQRKVIFVLLGLSTALAISLFVASAVFPPLAAIGWALSALPLCAASSPFDEWYTAKRCVTVYCDRLETLGERQSKLTRALRLIEEHEENLERWEMRRTASAPTPEPPPALPNWLLALGKGSGHWRSDSRPERGLGKARVNSPV